MPRLIIEEGQEKRYVRLTADVTSIGRADDNAVRIADIKSSRHHCELRRDGDRWTLVDLGSQNGTRVNGERRHRIALDAGDVVQIGATRLTFDDGTRARAARHASADAIPPSGDPPSGQIEAQAPVVRRRRPGGRRRRPRPRPGSQPTGQTSTGEAPEGITRMRATLTQVLRDMAKTFGDDGIAAASAIFDQVLEKGGSTLLEAYEERIDRLEQIQELTQAINTELDLQPLLERIIDTAIELTRAERGFLILHERERMNIEVARNFDRSSLAGQEIQLSRSIARRVATSGDAIIAADAREDDRFADFRSVMALELQSVVCLPLRDRDETIGVLYLDSRLSEGLFDDDDLDILETFADQAAIAIANARMHRLLAERVEATEASLVEARQLISQQQNELATKYTYDRIVGASEPMRRVFALLDKVTDTVAPVHLHGESGTGKELVAHAIHYNGPRHEGPFVTENCGAISESVLESELFGHVKGAFTGADRDKKGLFALADGGTLFLDEIGDMSRGMQTKLLRALQEGEIRPVGSKETIAVDVRIISASNRDLRAMTDAGEFREDLLYRVNAITVSLPPLRERKEDIPLLVEHLLERLCERDGTTPRQLDKPALRALMAHDWPGNIRELENELQRAIALSDDHIGTEHLSDHLQPSTPPPADNTPPALPEGLGLKDLVRDATAELEARVIASVLAECDYTKSAAAKRLGISRPTLDAKIDAYGIELP